MYDSIVFLLCGPDNKASGNRCLLFDEVAVFSNTEFGAWFMGSSDVAILCVFSFDMITIIDSVHLLKLCIYFSFNYLGHF